MNQNEPILMINKYLQKIYKVINIMITIARYFANSAVNYASRPEQRRLRQFLKDNHEPYCIICKTKVPVYALECAHIKPRSVSNNRERNDTGIVSWMCRNCHKFYDVGDVSVIDPGVVVISPEFNLEEYPEILRVNNTMNISEYLENKKYYDYHFQKIFKK